MVSSDTARMGIIKRAKQSGTAQRPRHKEVRNAIRAALVDPINERRLLAAAYATFEQQQNDASLSALARDDAAVSLEVLNAMAGLKNQIATHDFVYPPMKQPALMVAGVKVTVTLDVLIHGSGTNKEQIGGALFRFTQPEEEDGSRAATRRREMGIFAATLVRMQVAENFANNRTPAYPLCWSIDVQCGEIHVAHRSFQQREQNIENACRFISAMWGSV